MLGMVQAQEADQALSVNDSTTNAKSKIGWYCRGSWWLCYFGVRYWQDLDDLKNQGASTEDITRCGLLGKLMEDRLYAHQAVQDSLLVSDDMVNAQSDRQIQQLTQQIGSAEKCSVIIKSQIWRASVKSFWNK